MNVNQGAPRAVAVVLTVVTPLLASTGCSRDAQAMTPDGSRFGSASNQVSVFNYGMQPVGTDSL